MGWQLPIPADAAICGFLAVILILRLAASTPAAAVFLVLLTVPVLVGIARLHSPLAGEGFLQAVLAEAYAMMLGMALPLAVVLMVMERSRRHGEIRRCRDDIEDLRGWRNPAAARRMRGLVKRLTRLGVVDLDLTRCYLRQLNLSAMPLTGARLVGADMEGTNLSASDLSGADLQGAVLRRGILRRTRLSRAILWGADLREAVLVEADLKGAQLKEADLTGADLAGARLDEVHGLGVEQLGRARSLHGASLPPKLLARVKERHPALLRAG
jgi:hypothetical protein